GPVELIENETVAVPGSVATVDLRAQDPRGRYSQPMLALVSGRYPSGPGEVAVTSGAAAQFGLRTGGLWQLDGRALRVTGQGENPANLRDQFALLAPGQLADPGSVTVLYDARRCVTAGCAQARLHLPGGAKRDVGQPTVANAPVSLTPADGVLVLGALGLIFIGLVAVTGFTVMAQRRLRALGMLVAVGATDRDLRLVMVASGAAAGVVGALAGAVVGWVPGSSTRPGCRQAPGTSSTRSPYPGRWSRSRSRWRWRPPWRVPGDPLAQPLASRP
ncbi:MAG TPA: FtsX-like permease family protein, partial [Streptosporangiaceae bacterium]